MRHVVPAEVGLLLFGWGWGEIVAMLPSDGVPMAIFVLIADGAPLVGRLLRVVLGRDDVIPRRCFRDKVVAV
jgi:hypothetical protein